MKTYRMFVHERGSSQPFELIAQMKSDLRAVEFARQRIVAFPRILAIEIWSGESRVCRVQSRAAEAAASVGVELGVVAKDALLVERNATGRA
ncbi:MAG TPA: hypothetical protein VN694_15000 [Caulobacteraceae bacterium]|nr:hypothetical protein [Caulobacteraceae bacterium]